MYLINLIGKYNLDSIITDVIFLPHNNRPILDGCTQRAI